MIKTLGNAFKKMSQRAMWRGDRGNAQMIQNHGLEGMRQNFIHNTPTVQNPVIGLKGGVDTNASTKVAKKIQPNLSVKKSATKSGLGTNILNGLGL